MSPGQPLITLARARGPSESSSAPTNGSPVRKGMPHATSTIQDQGSLATRL